MTRPVWRLLIGAALVAFLGCGGPPAPRLAPDQAQAQQTLDRIARARSAVRWFAAVRVTLQSFEAVETQLHAAGRIDPTTHARLEEWIGIVQEEGIAALTAIEVSAKRASETGELTLSAEAVRDLLTRLMSLSERVAHVRDGDAWARLTALVERAASALRLVLQTLDPAATVPLGAAAGRVPSPPPLESGLTTVPAGVPLTVVPIRTYSPPRLGGLR